MHLSFLSSQTIRRTMQKPTDPITARSPATGENPGPAGASVPVALTRSVSRGARAWPTASECYRQAEDHSPIRSLYIHVPFCSHKCHYCDFYSFVDTRDQQRAFVDRLCDELDALAPHARGLPLKTIFVGGGTPSLLRLDLWEILLARLAKVFDLSMIRAHVGEFTVECNPESASAALLAVLKAGGVNRVSMGAQSFEPRLLKTLERTHNPENVARAIELARHAGIARQSIDLIFAIPGQTLDDWTRDLEQGLALGTSHISCYNLTYEPNTAMTARMHGGEFAPTGDDVEREMYAAAVRMCAARGLDRYEVSNFAAPGQHSAHNLAYWMQDQWLAAGPSAGGHALAHIEDQNAGSWRFKNVPRLGDYLDSAGFSPVIDVEHPDRSRLLRERIMMGLRLARGLDSHAMISAARAISPAVSDSLADAAARLEIEGLLISSDLRWRLTDEGFMVGDSVASELMNAVRSARPR